MAPPGSGPDRHHPGVVRRLGADEESNVLGVEQGRGEENDPILQHSITDPTNIGTLST